jgi:methionyl-tRNA synthetase
MRLVSTPIFYVNGAPHLGHASSVVLADACARWLRMKGDRVRFVTGTDEHGSKVERAAMLAQEPTKSFCDRVSKQFLDLAVALDSSHDVFLRTTEERHKETVRAVWRRLRQRGQLQLGSYSGYYCHSDESFVPLQRTMLKADGVTRVSADSGHNVEWLEESTYQLPLAPFLDCLNEWASKPGSIVPVERQREVVGLMLTPDAVAAPLSVSRSAARTKWGIGVPDDSTQIIYVWLDALCNYLTAAGFDGTDASLESCWPPDTQIVGKDILRFHCVVWPGLLLALGLAPPKRVLAHGHWTCGGIKMSKSLNNVVDPWKLLEEFGSDGMRYFLLAELNLAEDSSFVESSMREKLYNDLADTVGNLVRRCTAASLNPSRSIPDCSVLLSSDSKAAGLLKQCSEFAKNFEDSMNELDTRRAASLCLELARGFVVVVVVLFFFFFFFFFFFSLFLAYLTIGGNKFWEDSQPWKLKSDPSALRSALFTGIETVRVLMTAMQIFVPRSAGQGS